MMNIQQIAEKNRERITALIEREWYITEMVTRGRVIDMTKAECAGCFKKNETCNSAHWRKWYSFKHEIEFEKIL